MLCQGLKRVVKVEFDESGNPKEVSVAKEQTKVEGDQKQEAKED